MASIIMLIAALWCTMALAPETPVARAIRRWTVERPAARLSRITAGHVVLALLLIGGTALVGWGLGHESVRLMAMAAPDVAAWITMFEITAYLDAIAAVVAAASVTRVTSLWTWLIAKPRRPSAGRTRGRTVRVRSSTPANDDEDGADRACAA